jgi:flagellar hook-associated protein 3 FlgL
MDFDRTFMTELLAKNESVDLPEAIMNLKWLESVHNYALNIGSRIIRPTLMDFLR